MAQGDLRGTLTGSAASIPNPFSATGSVAVSVGDLIFGTVSQQTNLTATDTVTDNLGNTYTFVNAGTDAGTVTIRSFYSRVTTAGTLTSVDVPTTSSTNDASIVVAVIEGPFLTSPLDANPANVTDSLNPFVTAATGTLAQASEVVMGAIALANNQTISTTSPAVISGTVARNNASVGQSRKVVSSTSSVDIEFTGTSAVSGLLIASFKLDPDITLTQSSRFDDADTFHAHTVTNELTLSPSRHDDADSFHGPTITNEMPLTQDSRFDDPDTFHSAGITLELTLSPDRYDDPDTFHAHTITADGGDLTLSPDRYDDPDTFHQAAITGELTLSPNRFDDADTFHAATITNELTVAPDRYDNPQTFHAHGITQIVPSFHCVGNQLQVLANPIVGTWNVTILCTDDMGRQKQKVFPITLT